MNERETAQHFYEMLTGVFDDEQSKIVRYICFGALFLGILWAGWYYFRASVLADTDTPIDPDMFADVQVRRGDDSSLKRIVDLAQTIDTMRGAGTTIANTLEGIHNMPFNLDPPDKEHDDPMNPTASFQTQTQDVKPQAVPLNVRMIMTAKNGEKIALVDVGNAQAITARSLIVRQGDELPNEGGFVSAIRDSGVTVIFNKEEYQYDIAEIPKYDGIRKPGKKSRR